MESSSEGEPFPTRPQHNSLPASNENFPNRTQRRSSYRRSALSQHRIDPYDNYQPHHYSGHPQQTQQQTQQQNDNSSFRRNSTDTSSVAFSLHHPISNSHPNHPTNINSTKGSTTRNKKRPNRSLGFGSTSDRHSLHPYLHPSLPLATSISTHSSSLSQHRQNALSISNCTSQQFWRFIDSLFSLGLSDDVKDVDGVSKSKYRTIAKVEYIFYRLLFLLPLLYGCLYGFSSSLDVITQPMEFAWNPRSLNDRQCVFNLFVEKQKDDEFNPDWKEIDPEKDKNEDGTLPKVSVEMEPGTYRTKGHVKVIKRYIGSVADSFRPSIHLQQHLVFAGSRDGGHLAEQAMKFWPLRGKYTTQLYILADDDDAIENGDSKKLLKNKSSEELQDFALGYGSLSKIEERFQNHRNAKNIHIYDSRGQKAGLIPSGMDDDDIVELMEEEMFGTGDDDFDDVSRLPLDEFDDDTVVASGGTTYPSFKKLMYPHLERDINGEPTSDTEHVIPYLHVDGTTAARQFEILKSATPLLKDKIVSSVVVEHSFDMDMYELIDFFHSVGYKTFFLGMRQIARIDHLCPEILDQVINHPFITPVKSNIIRFALQALGIIEPNMDFVHPHPDNQLKYPPFFVALPRGRMSREEMTIQHMYDLFGGMSGGGQIKTANDR